ncbi:DUF3168 domain-containing protein [Kordiimonas laminariae]|uniref:DUF3168 domain-containing protein n=1 Tax=Kordiimonas laminariae TaxID=2917717 RepID=UPI001FF2977C|nr:DUF3168 domain-containing protein [Kordiimonas laminariae]MCK0068039.1 DUF3168 domain-containing protein [Kordiimonas laminariae]
MTAMASHRLQEAVFHALKHDETVSAQMCGIYDEPPTGARFPYLVMGDTNIAVQDLKDREGVQITFDVTLWSDEPSQMQVKELMAHTDAVLHEADLALVGFDLVYLRLANGGVIRQWNEQGSLYRGRLSYSALVYAL